MSKMSNKIDFQPKLFELFRNYSKTDFSTDLMAGIIVGIVALPLAVTPEKGIITAIVAGFIISLLGGSKVQIGGPTGAFIVIIYGIIQEYGIEGLTVATLMAGILLVLMGVFKLGAVIKFIPYPIIVGFTSGIAVTIFTTQIADVFGLTFDGEKVPGDFIGKWMVYARHFDTVNWWNALVSFVSIFIIAITPKFSKKIPDLHYCHYTEVFQEDSGFTDRHRCCDTGCLSDESLWRHHYHRYDRRPV